MNRLQKLIGVLGVVAGLAVSNAVVTAHDMLTDGTVLSVAEKKLEITSVNKSTKKEETVAFVIDEKTKVVRGTEKLAFANGKLKKGDKVTVVVNTDAAVKMLATEVRIAAQGK